MEPEYMRILDKYAGRHAKTLFWFFVFLATLALVTPVLINLVTIWGNVEWVFNHIGVGSIIGRIFTTIGVVVFAFLALRGLSIIVALGIRTAYATPIHWRIDNTLSKLAQSVQHIYEITPDVDKLRVVKIRVELDTIRDEWNASRVTRLVRWIVASKRRAS